MNNKKTSSAQIRNFALAWLAALALFVISFLTKAPVHPAIQIALGLLILLIAIIFATGGFHYLEIEPKDDLISIKYFNLFPIGREFKSLQIPYKRFSHIKTKNTFGGLFRYFYLYEQTSRGLARYPKIGLTSLSKTERNEIIAFFKKLEIK